MKRRLILLLQALGVLTTLSVAAQQLPSRFYIDHHTIPGVIKSSFVAGLAQDEYGLLWFGTSSGLFRFDGNEFIKYSFELPNGISIESRQINTVLWDRIGHRLLIGTRMAGLLQFDYLSNRVFMVTHQEETVNSIAQTEDGRIWIATPNGLFELKNNSLSLLGSARELLSPSVVRANGNELVVACVKQVLIFKDGVQKRAVSLQAPNRSFTTLSRVSAVLVDSKQQLWMGTENDGLLIFDYESGKFKKSFTPDQRPFFSRINAIHEDREGLIWVLTKTEGVVVMDSSNYEWKNLRQDIYEQNMLSSNNCYSFLEDQTGVLWLGTSGEINFYDREQRKFKHYSYEPNTPNSLSDNMVRSVYEARDGKLWIGTDGGFINLLELNSGHIEQLPVAGKELPENEAIIPFCFYEVSPTHVLVGTSVGLLVLDTRTKQFSYFKPTLPHLKQKRVRQLLKREESLYGIYMGTFFEFNLKTNQFFIHTLPSRNNVTVIRIDAHNRFWVGSNSAVSLFNTSTKNFVYQSLPRDTSNYMVLNIEQVGEKTFVSTMNNGIFEVEAKENAIDIKRNITILDGLPDNTVYATLGDDFGNTWIPTNRGLSRLDPNGKFTTYQVNEGLQGEEFNRLAQLKLSSGQLVLAGINGINIIDPVLAITKAAIAKPIIFSVATRKGNQLQETVMPVLDKTALELTDEETSFAIQFGINDYRKPVRYAAKYKLEGHDEAWQSAPTFSRVTYSQLRHGRYTFRLVITSPSGEQFEKNLAVYIKPPFWITWWFRIILSVLVIGIAIVSFRVRMNREKKDKERLEELLQQRTHEIEQSRQQLANLNERKDLIFSILSHDLRSPLTTLKGFLGLLIEDGAMFSKEEIKKHAEMIRVAVSNSLDLIDNTLFWSLSQMGGLQLNPVRVSVNEMVKKIAGLYHLALTRKGIKLNIDIEPGLHTRVDENMLYVILRNLVSNAIKFTPDGRAISIHAFSRQSFTWIEVKDEGIGMNQEYITKLFTEAHPVIKKGTSNEKGTGLGLVLCRQFLEANHGKLMIESEEHSGSTFSIVVPGA